MMKVVCIEKHKNCPSSEEIDDVLYLDTTTVFGVFDGNWYGEMYKKDENEKFVKVGIRLLSRFKNAW